MQRKKDKIRSLVRRNQFPNLLISTGKTDIDAYLGSTMVEVGRKPSLSNQGYSDFITTTTKGIKFQKNKEMRSELTVSKRQC